MTGVEVKVAVTAAERRKEKPKMTLERRAGRGETSTSELLKPSALSCSWGLDVKCRF